MINVPNQSANLPPPAVHFEDQLSSEKKCGHLGGKVLVPTQQAIRNLIAGEPGGARARRRLLMWGCAGEVERACLRAAPAAAAACSTRRHPLTALAALLTPPATPAPRPRSPPGGRRGGHPHRADCPHRRALRQPADLGHRRCRQGERGRPLCYLEPRFLLCFLEQGSCGPPSAEGALACAGMSPPPAARRPQPTRPAPPPACCALQPFCTGKRTPEGFYYVNCGVKVGPGAPLACILLEVWMVWWAGN